MKQQSVGIVLCALLLTTFGHDLLQRHQVAHSEKLSHHERAKYHHLLSRAQKSDQKNCHLVCDPPTDSGNLTISVNASASLVAVYNASAQIALVFDLKANFVGIFNLTTTGGVIINLQTQSAVEVTGLWEANATWSAALAVVSSGGLQVLVAKGAQVSVTKIAVLVQFALVVVSSGEYQVSAQESVGVLISVSKSLVVSFNYVLVVVKSSEFSAKFTLKKLVEVVGGLSTFISHIQGGVEVLVKQQISFSLNFIVTATSSFEIVGHVLQQLSGAGLIDVFGDLSNSTNVIKIIANLGGNSTQGVNGLVTVLVEILAIVHHQGSVDRVVAVLIEYFSSNDYSVKAEWEVAIKGFYQLIVKLQLQEKLKSVVELLVRIQEGKWVEENINISVIITTLVTFKDNDRLNAIAAVLVLLRARIAVEVAIATLTLQFIELLAVQGGVQIIVLITGIQVGAEYLAAGANVLVRILRSISIRDVIAVGFRGFFGFLSRLTIIGDLFIRINASFKVAGASQTVEGSFRYAASYQIVIRIQRIIVGVVRGSFHISGGVQQILPHTQVLPAKVVTENSTSSSGSEESDSSATTKGNSSGNYAIVGGAGGSGGAGGNSSGNAGSAGNSGNVSGGEGGSNTVAVQGNSGGNVGQAGGAGGSGGDGGDAQVEIENQSDEDDRHKGKHAKHARHHHQH